MAGAGIRRAGRLGVDIVSRRVGYDVIRRHFYSPIPDLSQLPETIWDHRSELRGVGLDVDAGLTFLRSQLAEYIKSFRPPEKSTGNPRDFYLNNGFYESLDAHTLYAMVRHLRPRRVLELGSGMSSLVIADALSDGEISGAEHVIYDPYPRADLIPTLASVADLRRLTATRVTGVDLARLEAGDILFVDTSHTVKVGGDVNHVVLELLPQLRPGVTVHVHDIYLPFEYPRIFPAQRRFFWAEQYLLQAFLAFNNEFTVLFANHALWRVHREAVTELIGSTSAPNLPSGFWLSRDRQ